MYKLFVICWLSWYLAWSYVCAVYCLIVQLVRLTFDGLNWCRGSWRVDHVANFHVFSSVCGVVCLSLIRTVVSSWVIQCCCWASFMQFILFEDSCLLWLWNFIYFSSVWVVIGMCCYHLDMFHWDLRELSRVCDSVSAWAVCVLDDSRRALLRLAVWWRFLL